MLLIGLRTQGKALLANKERKDFFSFFLFSFLNRERSNHHEKCSRHDGPQVQAQMIPDSAASQSRSIPCCQHTPGAPVVTRPAPPMEPKRA